MPAGSPEELHVLMAAAFNAGDLDAYAQLYEGHAPDRPQEDRDGDR